MKRIINFLDSFIYDYTILFVITIIAILIAGYVGLWNTKAYRDVDMLKEKAPSFVESRGYKITSYDGYQGSIYHGGLVWYQVRDKNDYLYNLAIGEWRGELMLYNQTCLNAVSSDLSSK